MPWRCKFPVSSLNEHKAQRMSQNQFKRWCSLLKELPWKTTGHFPNWKEKWKGLRLFGKASHLEYKSWSSESEPSRGARKKNFENGWLQPKKLEKIERTNRRSTCKILMKCRKPLGRKSRKLKVLLRVSKGFERREKPIWRFLQISEKGRASKISLTDAKKWENWILFGWVWAASLQILNWSYLGLASLRRKSIGAKLALRKWMMGFCLNPNQSVQRSKSLYL